MTNKEAIEILESHNRWRRGDDDVKETDPKLYGMALDKAIEVLIGDSNDKVFNHYGKPFTSGRDLWDFLTEHYNFTRKT